MSATEVYDDGAALRLFEEHQGLVAMVVARRAAGRGKVDREEIRQDALMGLWHACRRFEPGRGLRFSSYGVRCIDGFVLTGLSRRAGRNARAGRDVVLVSLDAPLCHGEGALTLADLVSDDGGDGGVAQRSAAAEVRRTEALRLCSDELDVAVVEAVWDGRSMRDVDRDLGLSVGLASKRRRRLAGRAAGGRAAPARSYRPRPRKERAGAGDYDPNSECCHGCGDWPLVLWDTDRLRCGPCHRRAVAGGGVTGQHSDTAVEGHLVGDAQRE